MIINGSSVNTSAIIKYEENMERGAITDISLCIDKYVPALLGQSPEKRLLKINIIQQKNLTKHAYATTVEMCSPTNRTSLRTGENAWPVTRPAPVTTVGAIIILAVLHILRIAKYMK